MFRLQKTGLFTTEMSDFDMKRHQLTYSNANARMLSFSQRASCNSIKSELLRRQS